MQTSPQPHTRGVAEALTLSDDSLRKYTTGKKAIPTRFITRALSDSLPTYKNERKKVKTEAKKKISVAKSEEKKKQKASKKIAKLQARKNRIEAKKKLQDTKKQLKQTKKQVKKEAKSKFSDAPRRWLCKWHISKWFIVLLSRA